MYKRNQLWKINNHKLLVLQILQNPDVVYVIVDPEEDGFGMPISMELMNVNTTELIIESFDIQSHYDSMYHYWKEQYDSGEAGYFDSDLDQTIVQMYLARSMATKQTPPAEYTKNVNKLSGLLNKHKLNPREFCGDWNKLKALKKSIKKKKLKNNALFKFLMIRWAINVSKYMENPEIRNQFFTTMNVDMEDIAVCGEMIIKDLLEARNSNQIVQGYLLEEKQDLKLLHYLYGAVDYSRLSWDEVEFLSLDIPGDIFMTQFHKNPKKRIAFSHGLFTTTIFMGMNRMVGFVIRDWLNSGEPIETDRVCQFECNKTKTTSHNPVPPCHIAFCP
jgi:hypothetical protein